ncbi:MAG: ABC transporter permease [Planktomarina sp.]
MDFSAINPALLTAAVMVASVPILLAAIGEMVVEKAGVLNLGVEGMMIMGAVCGFAMAMGTGSAPLGFIGAALGGMALSLVFALLTQFFLTNHVATGLALTLFGLGLSSMIGQAYRGLKPPMTEKIDFGPLSDIPFIGPAFFNHDWIVYFSLLAVVAVWAFLKFTRAGLVLRAVGENHEAAHALGYKIKLVRTLAIAFGGAMAGLGGAYISLVRVPQWVDGMTAGAGWIALAIVVFGAWRAGYVLLGAYLFGGVTVLQLNLQVAGVAIPVEYLSMSPYLITIFVLVLISATRARTSLAAPGSLGRIFHVSK